MKILVTGVNGQLGYDVMEEISVRGYEGIGVDVKEMDITDAERVKTVLTKNNPDVVIHCAAYTAVDAAEDNLDLCRKINAQGTRNIALVCKELNVKMVYISTDYVFDGDGEHYWEPDEARNPLNVYGLTKYEGEVAVQELLEQYFIVRISWVFGVNGNNFVKTMLKLGAEKDQISVVNDQIGSPTFTRDLAVLLIDMAQSEQYGCYHATNEGLCSWYEFAREIFRQAEIEVQVNPVSSEKFPSKAKRPHNSRMSKDKLEQNGFNRLPSWQNAVERYVKMIR